MIDTPIKHIDQPANGSDVSAKLLADAKPGGNYEKTADTSVPPGTLPALTISTDQADQGKTASAPADSGSRGVLSDLARGAYDEVTQHPANVLASAALGAGIGLLALAAGPEIAIAGAAVGAVATAYDLYKNVPTWIQQAKVVAEPDGYSPAEVSAAHSGLQGVGAGAADLTAALLGGGITSGGLASVLASGGREAIEATAETTAETTAESTASLPDTAVPTPPETATMAPASSASAAQAFTPFTVGDTTITLRNPTGWNSFVDFNGDEDYGAGSLQFANRWGTLMQERIAAGQPLTKEMMLATRSEAGGDTMSGGQATTGTAALVNYWEYGSQLQKLLGETGL